AGGVGRRGRAPGGARRRAYADALSRVHRKPGPWVYLGYRPPPRPANTVDWERTEAIAQALDRVLADPDRELRLAMLRRMQREKILVRLATRVCGRYPGLAARPAGDCHSWLSGGHHPGYEAQSHQPAECPRPLRRGSRSQQRCAPPQLLRWADCASLLVPKRASP